MIKKKKILLGIIGLIIILFLSLIFFEIFKEKKVNIQEILSSEYYSYLPIEAKEYIQEVYEETGVILSTEKNKKDGEPYLNPDYVEYLAYGSDINLGYIPDTLSYDYNYKLDASNIDNLPRKYDSRDVNGNSYVTPTKKQYSELCWDYALTSIIESKLLKEGFENDALSLDLSERMIDYASADPISAIDIGKNPYYGSYVLNSLAEGGNEYRYSSVLVNGLFPIDEENWNYEKEYMGKVKPEDVYDFNNIKYQVNEIKYLKDNNYSEGFDEDTNKLLKQYILENGSVGLQLRVGAGKNNIRYEVSEEQQLNNGINYNYLYYKDVSAVYQSNDHAVAIIGWDDDYVRNICVLDNGELKDSINNNGTYSCDNGKLKTINGVWIIKDSANSLFHYVAYETVNSSYFIVTDISYKNWNNVYSSSNKEVYTRNGNKYTFYKQSNIEKVNSVKIYSQKPITNLNIYIDTDDGNGEKILTTINTEVSGLYTIPINDEFILSSEKFTIKFSDYSISNFSVFTSNVDSNVILNIEDTKVVNSFNYQNLLGDYQNVIVASGVTRNINENINYVIKDSYGNDVTSLFNITRNYSIGNYVDTLIRFNNNVALGEYNAFVYVNDSLHDTFKIDISKYMEKISGDGSEENPFIITNPVQLDMMRLNKYNYYKLGADIDLTYDTQNENGLFYNDGLGWEPISYSTCSKVVNGIYCSDGFSGAFDGDIYKIIGLYINRPNEDAVGLFRNTYNVNYSGLNFRNIILKDVKITGKDYVGGLIGYAYGTTHERTLIFENISVTGSIRGNNYVGGLIGYFKGGTGLDNYLVSNSSCIKRHCLNNLFNSSKIEGNNYAGGIVGLLETQEQYNVTNEKWRATIDVYNWQNNGTVISDNKAAGLIGHVVINNGNVVTLNNSINTGIVKGDSNVAIFNDLECNNSSDTYPNCSLVLNNIYHINDLSYNNNDLIKENNVVKYDILDLTDDSIYNLFTEFDTFYKKETVNNIKRIPFLKNAYVEYSSARDISIDGNNIVNLYDYIDGSDNVIYQVKDDTIATIDNEGNITPLNNGNTTIHIISYYDGYEDTINLNITNFSKEEDITFENEEKKITFDTEEQTIEMIGATGGSGNYTYTEVSESNGSSTTNYISLDGTTIKVVGNTPAGTYKYIVKVEDTSTKVEKTKEITIVVKPKELKATFVKGENVANIGKTSQTCLMETSEGCEITLPSITAKSGYRSLGWSTSQDGTNKSSVGSKVTIKTSVTYYSFVESSYINVENYIIEDETVKNISENTTVNQYMKNFNMSSNYEVKVYNSSGEELSENQLVFTGSVTKVYFNNKLYKTYFNIVFGDITGDGQIKMNDVMKLATYIIDNSIITESYYIEASDFTNDSMIKMNDVMKLATHVLGGE